MSSIRMKVNTADLLEKVKAKKAEKEAAHVAALRAHEKKLSTPWDVELANKLESELVKVRKGAGKYPKERHSRGVRRNGSYTSIEVARVEVSVDIPEEPTLDTRREDRDISLLEISSQDSITITADGEWSYYL